MRRLFIFSATNNDAYTKPCPQTPAVANVRRTGIMLPYRDK